MNQPSQDSLRILESLRTAVAKALERKRRLGQYAVIWQDGKLVRINPLSEQATQVQENPGKYRGQD
jgi:hypothetical protein